MVTYSDSVFEMMKTRIENIERMQKRLFTCLSECEAQICQVNLTTFYIEYSLHSFIVYFNDIFFNSNKLIKS